MRQQLLSFFALCASFLSFAQIPTNGLIKDYKFTNGSISSDTNPILFSGSTNLVATGNSRTNVIDRNNQSNKAVSLNGDTFNAGGTNEQFVNTYGISFWVKTSTNTTEKKYIFDQFYQTNPCGWSVALQNGKIVFNAQSNVSTNSIYTYGQIAELISTNTISDNNWHHIFCQAKTTATNYFDGTFNHNTGTTVYEMYIDNVLVVTDTKTLIGYFTNTEVFRRKAIQSNQNLFIAKSTNASNTGMYMNEIDQIRFYESSLLPAEIEQLFAEDKPLTPIYVNSTATGNNDGTSWANAYTNLQTAINATVASTNEIWVAAGTYKPNGTVRTSTFTLKSNIKIYGGFNGSETTRAQRNTNLNITRLSGDISGNDNSTITATETTRQDNAYHVISLLGNIRDAYLDGFTICNGNANGPTLTSGTTSAQYYHTRGGAIYLFPYTPYDAPSIKVQNCIFEKNSGSDTGVFANYFANGISNLSFNVNIENCVVRNNYSGTNAQILINGASGYSWYGNAKLTNTLFHNNVSGTGPSCLYLSASTASGGTALGINTQITNCTFSNNTGVNGNVIRTDNGSNNYFRNSIIYGNGSVTPLNITGTGGPVINSTNICQGAQIGGQNVDPLLNTDYTLQVGSPAIDTGDNAYIPGTIVYDLGGNTRINNSIVDLGAFEYYSVLNSDDFNNSAVVSIYPNPTSDLLNIMANENIKSIKLFSLDGKQVIETQNTVLQIQELNSGIYFLSLELENGAISNHKIIKK